MNDYCECCGEAIADREPRYVFPGGYTVCEECVGRWVEENYRESGVIDLGA